MVSTLVFWELEKKYWEAWREGGLPKVMRATELRAYNPKMGDFNYDFYFEKFYNPGETGGVVGKQKNINTNKERKLRRFPTFNYPGNKYGGVDPYQEKGVAYQRPNFMIVDEEGRPCTYFPAYDDEKYAKFD